MIENTEAANSKLITEVYECLNSLDAHKLSNYFFDDAALYSLNDAVPPMEGKQKILEFFEGFFAQASGIEFELIGKLHPLGSLVSFKHIDHFVLDGIKHDDFYVSTVLIVDGKIKKWLGYLQET